MPIGKKYDRNCFFSPVQCNFLAFKDKSFTPEDIAKTFIGRRRFLDQ